MLLLWSIKTSVRDGLSHRNTLLPYSEPQVRLQGMISFEFVVILGFKMAALKKLAFFSDGSL